MSAATHDVPLLEYDAEPGVIEPSRLVERIDIPASCVVTFFRDVLERLVEAGQAREVAALSSEMGRHPVYVWEMDDQPLALVHPGVGAPLAAGLLEEVIALGCRRFIVCGGAGVLVPEIVAGAVVVPIAAVRDEGTSYHYAPPSREIAPTPEAVDALERVLQRHGVPYRLAKTWTTDAFYRETPRRVRRRRDEGCVTVEMEAAALFAVARFRGVALAQLLYGGDDLSGLEWDARDWQARSSIRERLVWLAAQACLELGAEQPDGEPTT